MKTHNFHTQSGFTLIELMVVLLITSLLLSGGAFYWQQWSRHQQRQVTAKQLQAFLIRVREHADWYNQDFPLWIVNDAKGSCLGAGLPPARGKPCPQIHQRLIWHSPYPVVGQLQLIGEPGFYGSRSVAKAGSILFGDSRESWRVIISSQARVRYCQSSHKECE